MASKQKKILRQGMNVSISQLRFLADSLEREGMSWMSWNQSAKDRLSQMWEISIINKQPECSDTWELEFKHD